MKLIAILFLTMSTIALANDPHNNSGNNNRSIVTCSSKNSHRKICHADTSGGVQLIKQLSRSSCHNNWGYTRNQIWVDNGCRARFQLYVGNSGGHNNSQPNTHNNGYSNNSNTHNNGNNSNSNTHNNSYNSNTHNNGGNTNTGNHNNGNRNGHNNQSTGNRIVCESINSRRNSCSIPHGARISLYKQLSHSSCEHNWGFNDSQIWVTNGCRAEFSIINSH